MYLMYVDESGDSGLTNSPTQFFVLSGLVAHEIRWLPVLQQIMQFRRWIRNMGHSAGPLAPSADGPKGYSSPSPVSRIAE